MNNTFDYYEFRINYVSEKINDEINFYTDCKYNDLDYIITYIKYLSDRFGSKKIEDTRNFYYGKTGNKCEIKKMDRAEYFKNINISVYSKEWKKLKDCHKILKIKEFVNGLKYKNNNSKQSKENRVQLYKKLCKGLQLKRFNKNKNTIDYDDITMSINSISCINYNKKKDIYEIVWDE